MQLFLTIFSEIENSTDPDQSALFAYAVLSETLMYEILGHLR